MGTNTPPALFVAPSDSDAASTLRALAARLIEAASKVDQWAGNPGCVDLQSVRQEVLAATESLSTGIASHLLAATPSLEKLRWKEQVLKDKVARLYKAQEPLFFEHRPEYAEARTMAMRLHDEAYRAYLDTQQEIYKHPDFVPRRARKKPGRGL